MYYYIYTFIDTYILMHIYTHTQYMYTYYILYIICILHIVHIHMCISIYTYLYT